MLDEVRRATGREDRVASIAALAEAIQLASLCGLGQAAPLAVLGALETSPEAFREGA